MTNAGSVDGEIPTRSPFCSGICDWCRGPNDGQMNWYLCPACYETWQGQSNKAPVFHQKVSLRNVQATTGHIKDIKSRRLEEDGRSVRRDKGTNPIYIYGGSHGS